ncbi:MAG: hypothetical protein ACRC5C_13370 [Bacilli bacterium]
MANHSQLFEDFVELLSEDTSAFSLIGKLMEEAQLLLFGGTVRHYAMHDNFNTLPRDFDIVIVRNIPDWGNERLEQMFRELDIYDYRKNKFNGYKVTIGRFRFDFWFIEKTWAFDHNYVPSPTICNLTKTVPFSIDAIFYNLNTKQLVDDGFKQTLDTGALDLVLEALLENPCLDLNIVRAYKFRNEYSLFFTPKLQLFIHTIILRNYTNPNFIANLYAIEQKRYGKSTIDWEEEIAHILADSPLVASH